MPTTFLLAPLDFQTFLRHIQQHQHQLQLARPALFIFSFRPKNLVEVIVRHCQSTVSVTSKARDLGIEQRHMKYQLKLTPRASLCQQNSGHIASQKTDDHRIPLECEKKFEHKNQMTSIINFYIFHLMSHVKNLVLRLT